MVTLVVSLFSIAFIGLLDDPAIAIATREKLDGTIQKKISDKEVVGLGVAFVENGKIVWRKGYGFADRENQIPVDPNRTQFRWASISKSVTAVAAMQLVEQHMLDLDVDVRTYVPEFPDKGVKITARQLLCHQGGIVHYSNGEVRVTKREYATKHPFQDVVTALDKFKDSPLVCQPGEKYSYTTHGYILLSAVVERAGGKPFAQQVSERIAKPLDMEHFRPDYEWEEIPNRTAGYRRDEDKKIVRRPANPEGDVSWKLGGGGFTSTTEDLAKFAIGLSTRKLLDPETQALMWRVNTPANPEGAKPYGFGFFIMKRPENRVFIGHDGSQEKTRTCMLLEPASGRGVVLMSNSEWFDPTELAVELLEIWR